MVNFYLLETGREPPDVIVNYARLDTWILIATHACSNQSGKNSPYSLMLMHLSAEVLTSRYHGGTFRFACAAFFAVFPKVRDIVLIYSKYHLQILLKLATRASESYVVV